MNLTNTDPEALAKAILAAASKQQQREQPKPDVEEIEEPTTTNKVVDTDFPVLVKKLRTHYGQTQVEFADEMDVCFTTVNRWERGKNVPSKPVQNQIKEMARAAGLVGPAVDQDLLNGDPTAMKAKAMELGLIQPELEIILSSLSQKAQSLILEAVLLRR